MRRQATSRLSFGLMRQLIQRLSKDLQLDDDNSREWRIIENPSPTNGVEDIKAGLREWRATSSFRQRKKTSLLVVMKQKMRLESLVKTLRSLGDELKGVPVLIVDDEADQAGMNTEARPNRKRVANGEPERLSVIHKKLVELKEALPHHTFVQYTATPQAPLFIRRQDSLSPNFIKLLTPGAGYTGGNVFFGPKAPHNVVKIIPETQVYSDDNFLSEPPSTLKEALREFFLGVADYFVTNAKVKNRSMMIHPSQLRDIHQVYHDWTVALQKSWVRILARPTTDSDRQDLLAEFKVSYDELHETSSLISPFEELAPAIGEAVEAAQVRLLNAGPNAAPQIDWNRHEVYILVGGQAMDRGFTVEGLTVTYMPRGLGTGTADTLQQRARFFGYKQSYLHLCRVYLTSEVEEAFRAYVEHEVDLRERLVAFDGGRTLNDFERQVVLPSVLTHLARPAVLSDDVERYEFGGSWLQTHTVTGSDSELQANKQLIKRFLADKRYVWAEDPGDSVRTEDQRHQLATTSLADVIKLLSEYDYLSTDDSASFTMLVSRLELFQQVMPTATAQVYNMSSGKVRARSAVNGRVRQLFQGRNPKKGLGKMTYPGDKEIKDETHFCLQIHHLRVKDEAGPGVNSFALAIWVPSYAGVELVKLASE